MEIERKFAGKMSADFATIFGTVELHSLEQFYSQISKDSEVRYRTTDGGFVKTVKKGKGLTREETETPVTEDEWNEAKKNMVGNYIEKERLKIPIGKLIIEIDVYSRPITNGWAMIEVEFPTEDDASCFSLPSKITQAFTKIREVTEDERFKNKNIALIGFPTFMDGTSTGDEVLCKCGERVATWKGVPTQEFQKEYPDEDWYFCDDCMESLFAGTWSGGGPFSSDFTSFSKVGVERPPRPDHGPTHHVEFHESEWSWYCTDCRMSLTALKSIDAIVDARDDDFVFDELTGEIADEICRRHVKRDPESEKHEDIKDIIRDRIIAYRDGKPLEFGDGDEVDT